MKIPDGKIKYALFATIASAIVALDQWTKHLIHSNYRLGQSTVMIPSFFDLTYLGNRGAAFSLLDSAPPSFREPFFLAVPVIALGAILVVISRMNERQRLSLIGLSLVFGGALGNLVDRLQLGYVVTFCIFTGKRRFTGRHLMWRIPPS